MTSIFNNQSDLSEVRDQLSLDYADGSYLSVISANLGVERPPFGFSDAQWRAITRVVALQPKQIRLKFEQLLEIVLGPKTTRCTALASNALAGDRHIVLMSTASLPQVGTMTIDTGLGVEETVNYVFIDRYTNTVYLETPLVNNHTALAVEWTTGIISPYKAGSSFVNVFDPSGLPDPASVGNYPVALSVGTSAEWIGLATSYSFDARKIGVSFPTAPGSGIFSPSGIQVKQAGVSASPENAGYVTMVDVNSMPLSGGFIQGASVKTYTATAGSTTSATITGPITDHRYGGFWVRFTGNVTVALKNQLGYIEDNTSTVFTFANILPASVAVGDTFNLLPNLSYVEANAGDNSVLLKRELPDLLTFPAGEEFSVVEPQSTLSIAQVIVKGTGWDVFQSNPSLVEVLIPSILQVNDLRSASYVRDTSSSGSTTAFSNAPIGASSIALNAPWNLPLVCVLNHTASSKRYTYYRPHSYLTADAAVGATTLSVQDTSLFASTGTLRVNGTNMIFSVIDSTTIGVPALAAAIDRGTLVEDRYLVNLTSALTSAVTAGDTIQVNPDYNSGNLWVTDNVWPGPYVWDIDTRLKAIETTPGNFSTSVLAGPTTLDLDALSTSTVIEVQDGSSFPTSYPYQVLLGENSGNVETLTVQSLSLKSRTFTSLSGAANIGDTTLTVASLSGPVAPANTFPNGGPYRVIIDPFTANAEVVIVTGTTGLNTLNLSTSVTINHSIGKKVYLLSDLLKISPSLGDDHLGNFALSDRQKIWPPMSREGEADWIRPLYTSVTLNSGAVDFTNTQHAYANFGSKTVPVRTKTGDFLSAGSTALLMTDTSKLPTTGYPYVVYVDVGGGPLLQEAMHVTNNNTGTNTLTVSHGLVFAHDVLRDVWFVPGNEEIFSYTSVTSPTINFSTYLLISNTHYKMEFLAPAGDIGYPRHDGYDFPLRLPVDLRDRLSFLIDLVRAAGVLVLFIDKR